jgi:hypothetical protein
MPDIRAWLPKNSIRPPFFLQQWADRVAWFTLNPICLPLFF